MINKNSAAQYLEAGRQHPEFLVPGIVDQSDVESALQDDTTLIDGVTGVPLAVGLQHNSWYRSEYFRQRGLTHDLFYLSAHETLSAAINTSYESLLLKAVQYAHERKADLVFEYSTHEKEVLRQVVEDAGILHRFVLAEILGPDEPKPADYLFEALYRHYEMRSSGTIGAVFEYVSPDPNLYVAQKLDDAQVVRSYRHYRAAFQDVQDSSPLEAVFSEDEYRLMMTSSDYIKFVYEDEKGPANICVANSVRHCNWINQSFVEQRFPQAYERDEVLFCPGIFSRPNAPKALSLRTLGLAARAFAAVGVEPIVIIECNDVSAQYIPRLFHLATQKTGVSQAQVSNPLQVQHVEVLATQ